MENQPKNFRLIKAIRHDYIIKSALDEEIGVRSFLYQEKEYDEKGNLIREVSFDETGGFNECFTYEYDHLRRIQITKSFFTEEDVAETMHYHYNEDDLSPVGAEKVYADGSKDFLFWKYDEEGRLIKKVVINDEEEEEESETWKFENALEVSYEKREMGEIVFAEERTYNSEGMTTSITYYDGETGQTIVSVPHYDEEGRQTGMEQFNDRKQKIGTQVIKAFAGEKPAEMMITDAKGEKRITRLTYDHQGQELSVREYNDADQLISETLRSYTSEGLIESTEVMTDRLGTGINQHYKIVYQYIP